MAPDWYLGIRPLMVDRGEVVDTETGARCPAREVEGSLYLSFLEHAPDGTEEDWRAWVRDHHALARRIVNGSGY